MSKTEDAFVAVSPGGYVWVSSVARWESAAWESIAEDQDRYREELVAEGWRVVPCKVVIEEPT